MGSMKLILGLVVIVALIYGAWQLIPPYFANYQFEDDLKNIALNATYSTRSEEEIKGIIYKKARDLDIPLSKDQIKVTRTGTQGTGQLIIDVDYTVHVDLPVVPMDLRFHPSTANKGIY